MKKMDKVVLENTISMLEMFYQVITDGYNPTSISIRIDLDKRINENEIKSGYEKGWYKEDVFMNPETVLDFKQRLKSNFKWSFEHLEVFSKCPELLKTDFNMDNFIKILSRTEQVILDFTNEWSKESKEYLIDTSDGSYQRLLVVHDENKSMIIEFGNYIH